MISLKKKYTINLLWKKIGPKQRFSFAKKGSKSLKKLFFEKKKKNFQLVCTDMDMIF